MENGVLYSQAIKKAYWQRDVGGAVEQDDLNRINYEVAPRIIYREAETGSKNYSLCKM